MTETNETGRAGRMDGPRLAVSLLTIIPLRHERVDRETARRAMTLAPAVGLVPGAAAASVIVLAGAMGLRPLLGAALAVAVMALLTRGLHLDGLADLADGLGSGRPADDALTIMKRSDIGPFGVVTLVLTLMIQVTAIAQTPHRVTAVLVAVVTGRLALPWACRRGVPAARPDGLGALVAGTVKPGDVIVATGAVVIASATAGALAGGADLAVSAVAAILAGLTAATLLRRHAVRRLGGVTGDVLGALVETATTTALVVTCLG